jgi:hypothetical protein
MQLSITSIEGIQQTFLPIDMVIAIDSSDSMEDNDHNNSCLSVAKVFADKLNSTRDKSGLVSWDDDIDITSPLALLLGVHY